MHREVHDDSRKIRTAAKHYSDDQSAQWIDQGFLENPNGREALQR